MQGNQRVGQVGDKNLYSVARVFHMSLLQLGLNEVLALAHGGRLEGLRDNSWTFCLFSRSSSCFACCSGCVNGVALRPSLPTESTRPRKAATCRLKTAMPTPKQTSTTPGHLRASTNGSMSENIMRQFAEHYYSPKLGASPEEGIVSGLSSQVYRGLLVCQACFQWVTAEDSPVVGGRRSCFGRAYQPSERQSEFVFCRSDMRGIRQRMRKREAARKRLR